MTERELFSDSAQGLLATGLTGTDLLARAVEDGWADGLTDDPAAATAGLFGAAAELLTPGSPLLDLVTLGALTAAGAADLLPRTPLDTAVLYPVRSMSTSVLTPTCGTLGAGSPLHGYVLAGVERATNLIVPVEMDGAVSLARFELSGGHSVEVVTGADPTVGLRHIVLEQPPAAVLAPDLGARLWGDASAAARVAVAHELTGLTRAMLERSVDHVTVRRQFGRPIGSFQAVRHQLAEVFVAVESATLALDQAAEEPDPQQAAIVKSMAGVAHATAADKCLQVHGAIGFTAEHDLHRYIRRGWMLDALLGSWRDIDAGLGVRMLADRAVPRLGDLVAG